MDKKRTIESIKTNDIFKLINVKMDKFLEILKKIEKDDGNYEITKLLAIKYKKNMVSESWVKHINCYKKQDDLCDAFLQGYHYMNRS